MDLIVELEPGTAGRTAAVYRALRAAILDGRVPAGHRLPSTRVLAADLGCPGAVWRGRTNGWRRRGS